MPAIREELNLSAVAVVQAIEELMWVHREYGMDVQVEVCRAIDTLDCTQCATIDDAVAFINFGRRMLAHAAVTLGSETEAVLLFSKAADWYIGIGVSFLASGPSRGSIWPSMLTLQ